MIQKVVATTALAVGLGVAGMLGASPAQATGLSVDVNGDGQSFDIGSGATTKQSGQASNNPSLAVSIFGDASTDASGQASGNVLIAVDGEVKVAGQAENNLVVNVGGKTNTVAGQTAGVQSVTICGAKFSGNVQVNPLQGGIC